MTGQLRRVDEQLATFCEAEHAQLTGLLTLMTGDRHVAEELLKRHRTRQRVRRWGYRPSRASMSGLQSSSPRNVRSPALKRALQRS